MKIILASASPRRKKLLTNIFPQFEVLTSDAPEKAIFTTPAEFVCELARQKAEHVIEKLKTDSRVQQTVSANEEIVIISADTIVFQDEEVLGKPATEEDAFRMLRSISGKTHEVYTGVSVFIFSDIRKSALRSASFAESTKVSVAEITDCEIMTYISSREPFDKAGAYGIQGQFSKFIRGIEGDYFNVVGLPVCRLYEHLKKLGVPCTDEI